MKHVGGILRFYLMLICHRFHVIYLILITWSKSIIYSVHNNHNIWNSAWKNHEQQATRTNLNQSATRKWTNNNNNNNTTATTTTKLPTVGPLICSPTSLGSLANLVGNAEGSTCTTSGHPFSKVGREER